MAVPFAALQMCFSERWGGGGRGESRVFSPLCDPSAQGLVLSKLCQPCNDLQQRTVSLLIGRPSPWPPPPPPPPLCLGIPLPRRLPDLPCLHLSHPHQLTTHAPHPSPLPPPIRPSPPLLLSVPEAHAPRLLSPPLETAYQGPHVICLQDLTDRATSEITSYYQRGGGGARGVGLDVCSP